MQALTRRLRAHATHRYCIVPGPAMKLGALLFVCLLAGCQPFEQASVDLLTETGVHHRLLSCSGGWMSRIAHCDLAIAPGEFDRLVVALDVATPTHDATRASRAVRLAAGDSLDDPRFAAQAEVAFMRTLWTPSRHGFAGAFLVYDPSREVARLWLSIAYG